MGVYGFLAALYGVPFLLVAFLPGWRTLLIVGALIGIPVTWAIWDINRALNDFDNDPGIGAVFAILWMSTIAAGLMSGLVVRTATLLLHRRFRSLRVTLVATLVGLFVTPGAYAGLVWWSDWTRRPPSAACLESTFRVQIAGATYAVPAAPVFSVVTSSDNRKGIYYFAIANKLRAFCGLASSSSSPVRATALHIDFEAMRRSYDTLVRTHCEAPADWIAPLCQGDPLAYADYPVEMSLYSPGDYNHRRMLASETHQNFLRAREAAEASGKPLSMIRIGNFDVYSNRYWVAREGPWESRLAEPLTLSCYDSSSGGLYCSTTHEAPQGAQITYEFRTQKSAVEASVATIEDAIARVLMGLATQ